MLAMLRRYMEVHEAVEKVLSEFPKSKKSLSEEDLQTVRCLIEALTLFEELSKKLASRDMDILKADKLIDLYTGFLEKAARKNHVAKKLKGPFHERITSRRNPDLAGLLRFLTSGQNYERYNFIFFLTHFQKLSNKKNDHFILTKTTF